ATGADSYLWTPANVFDDNTLANPVFIGDETTTISLTGNTTCGSETIEITIEVGTVEVELEEEILMCPGESTQLNASGGVEYSWFPATFLDDANIPNPTTSPDTDVSYEVTVVSEQGCEGTGSIDIILLDGPPILSGETDYATCNSVPVELEVSGGANYTWTPEEGLSDPSISNPTANPSSATTYTVTSTNQCGSASLEILVRTEAIDVSLTTDSIGCFLTPIGVSASGGSTYRWTPENLFANPTAENTSVEISATTEISVIGFNEDGCFDTETRLIRIFPREPIYLGLDEIIPFGGEAIIEAFSEYPIRWEDSPYLSCLDCRNPVASPPETSTFYATIETPDGCIETDSILVTVTGNIYVPNAFSPDGDGINDLFKAEGIDIVEFKMEIFDRWGELIFVSNSIEDGWNGSSPNDDYYAPSDTYPYRIVAREHTGEVFELKGMVTLIR
ncbi:MAG: gliding motility-associated C-terminal domain-containing protein, partial [Cryomorphaceae bacterium]